MLKLYIGRAGTGKTTRIHEELSALAEQHPTVPPVILVPEQSSFETERALLTRMGAEKASYVRVLSFTRLAETVAKEVGGLSGKRVNDASRALLISQALETVADHLTLYRRQVGSAAFVDTVLNLLSECKQCAITPAQLEAAGNALGGSVLGQKAHELSLIFEAYEALLKGSYTDPLDNLSVLVSQLPQASLLKGADIYIDGFTGFTQQELDVIRVMIPLAASVTVALCTPTLQDDSGGFGLFSPVIRTANQLLRMAEDAGITRAAPTHFTVNYRAVTPALKQLESEVFSPLPVAVEDCEGVTLTPCPDIYAECTAVARRLRRCLREENRRARDLAIVMRDPATYHGVLDAALRREGVPFYFDERESILAEPLSALILTAVRIAVEGYRTDRLLPLMKTGLCGFCSHSVAMLENYAYMWHINGAQWDQEWTMNPAGLTVRADKKSDSQLYYLNLLRSRLIRPLAALNRTLREPLDGESFARAVWNYLKKVRADHLVTLQVHRLKEAGEWDAAERQSQLWSLWTELLDTMATALGNTKLSGRRMLELLQQVATSSDIGSLPAVLDGVQVGAVNRVRLASPQVVCILGANEGTFPAYPTADGLLSDHERHELIRLGLSMTEPTCEQAMEERFYAYTALSAPSQELHISWLCGNSAGEPQAPSVLVSTVRQVLPCLTDSPCVLSDGSDLQSAEEALMRLATDWQHPTATTATLRAALETLPEHKAALARICESDDAPAAFRNPAAAQKLFGDDMRLSPSQVDAFYQCRFAYFCRYGLKVQPPRPAELGAAEFGTLAHTLMEQALPTYVDEGVASITRERVNADSKRILNRYVEEQLGGANDKGVRFSELMERLTVTASELLWHVVEELNQSRFVPTDFELPIGIENENGDMLPATVLTLPDGSRIQVRGVVDRVDVYHQDGRAYVRVVDYKTGSKKFRLSDVVEGLNLQMLIYLFTIWENGGPRYGSVTPAGVLYLPATLPVISAERDISPEQLHTEQLRAMKMNGLLLDDPEIIQAMEADANGIFIPAKLNKQGKPDARSSEVASLGRLGRLKKRVETLLIDMANTLRAGDIAAVPITGSRDACEWCDYRAICRHEAEDPVRFLDDRPSEKVWEELEQEESDK